MLGRVLIIAGSDSGGGAGVQADIKTVTVLGGYASTAITAITVQNTRGVFDIVPVAPSVIAAQARAVLDDIGADAVKIGMLGATDVITAVTDVVSALGADVPVVLDPVMVAKGGAALMEADAMAALGRDLMPLCALVTPNAPEAERLTGLRVENLDDQRRAASRLIETGARAVLVKGGHLPGERITDLLMTDRGETLFEGPRIETRHTHGTGCTLASACAALLAQGLALDQAVARAWAYVAEAIRHAPGFGGGHGPLDHGWPLRSGS